MIRINLAPPSVKKGVGFSIPSFNLGMLFGGIAVLIVLVLGVWWWSLSSEIRRLNVEIAENNPHKPVWPKEPFQAFLKLAFAGRIIDSDDHEYVRQLRGISA